MNAQQVTSPQAQPQQPVSSAEKPARTPEWIIVMLLFVFPPIAWVLMWKEKRYHAWFVKILIISGLITIVSSIAFYFTTVPYLTQLYASLNVENTNEEAIVLGNILGILLSVLQILYALYLRRRLKKNGKLSLVEYLICIVLLIVNLYVALIGPLLIAQSLYAPLMKLMGY